MNGGDTSGRSTEVARVIGSCREARRLRPSVFQHSKALNFAISGVQGFGAAGDYGVAAS
jgi:hypothetical protein